MLHGHGVGGLFADFLLLCIINTLFASTQTLLAAPHPTAAQRLYAS